MADVGRPTVMTPEILSKLREAFLFGCSDREACLYAGIAPATLYNYQTENPEYVEQKEMMKENPTVLARKTVYDKMADNGELALKYLERKKRDEFSTKQETDNTTKVSGSLVYLPANGEEPNQNNNGMATASETSTGS